MGIQGFSKLSRKGVALLDHSAVAPISESVITFESCYSAISRDAASRALTAPYFTVEFVFCTLKVNHDHSLPNASPHALHLNQS